MKLVVTLPPDDPAPAVCGDCFRDTFGDLLNRAVHCDAHNAAYLLAWFDRSGATP